MRHQVHRGPALRHDQLDHPRHLQVVQSAMHRALAQSEHSGPVPTTPTKSAKLDVETELAAWRRGAEAVCRHDGRANRFERASVGPTMFKMGQQATWREGRVARSSRYPRNLGLCMRCWAVTDMADPTYRRWYCSAHDPAA